MIVKSIILAASKNGNFVILSVMIGKSETCEIVLISQEMKSKKEMMRILRTTENEIVLDTTGRKNGRGAYLCKNPECLRKAIKSRGLERSFKMAIPQEVYDRLEKEMEGLAEG